MASPGPPVVSTGPLQPRLGTPISALARAFKARTAEAIVPHKMVGCVSTHHAPEPASPRCAQLSPPAHQPDQSPPNPSTGSTLVHFVHFLHALLGPPPPKADKARRTRIARPNTRLRREPHYLTSGKRSIAHQTPLNCLQSSSRFLLNMQNCKNILIHSVKTLFKRAMNRRP